MPKLPLWSHRRKLPGTGDPESPDSSGELERWSQWALAQADRIDPAIGGTFLKAMQDEDETKK
jgi:hypothetical protein